MRYLDPKADLTFKKIFGEHKDLLISLLNALLPLADDEQIKSVEYLSPELVPDTYVGKNSIVDVRCRDVKNRQFIVEMQMLWTEAFKQRVLFNASKAFVRQLDKKRKYEMLQPVYSLNLVNTTFEPDTDNCYHYYSMVHHLDTKKKIDGLHLVFVELPKFKPQSFAEKKMAVLWLKFLTEIDEKTRTAPQELLDNPEVSKALEIVEESAYSDAEMAAYEGYWDAVRREATFVGELDDARAELAEERKKLDAAKAELEKLRQDKLNTARQMKADGMAVGTIAKYTGLAADEIARLSLPLGLESAPRSPR